MQRPDHEQWKSKEVARLLALVETERRYWQDIVSTLPIALAILHGPHFVASANRAFREAFGLKKEDLQARTLAEIFPDAPELGARIAEAIAAGPHCAPKSFVIHRNGQALRATILPHREWDEDTNIAALLALEDLSGTQLPLLEFRTPVVPPPPPPPVTVAPVAADPVVIETENLEAIVNRQQEPAAVPVVVIEEEESAAVAPAPAAAVAPVPAVVVETSEPVPAPPVAVAPAAPSMPASIPAAAWTLSRKTHRFTYLSESAAKMLSAPANPEEWPWLERIAEADRPAIAAHYDAIFQTAMPDSIHSCEFRMAALPVARWFRETVRVEPDALQGIITDISERRTLQNHFVQSQRVDALAQIAGRIAHDLNNPLMIVGGYGEEILESFAANDQRRKDMQQVLDAADRIGEITASLQAFSRKPTTPIEKIGKVNLTVELSTAVTRMLEVAGESLTVDYHPPTTSIEVIAESRGLQSLIFELTAALSDTPTIHVALRARPAAIQELAFPEAPNLAPGAGAIILLENRGPVAAAGSTRKMPLFESPLPGKEEGNDSGNTLARAFRHVESWGGSLWVSPDQRTVRILLRGTGSVTKSPEPAPVVAPSPEPVVSTPVVDPQPAARPASKRILVVDDEVGIRSLMSKILLREGYEVLDAEGATPAMELVRQQPIDLLLTDVVMPEVNGRELAEMVLALRPEVKVLYVSGFTDETGVETGNYPPGSMLLQKPFTLGSLLKKVKEVLGEK